MKLFKVPNTFAYHHLNQSIAKISLGVGLLGAAFQVQASDSRPATSPVGHNAHAASGAEQLDDGALELNLQGHAARRVQLQTRKSAEDNQFLSETGEGRFNVGYGISQNFSLHLGAQATRHLQKKTDTVVVADESSKYKYASSSLALRYRLTDGNGWYQSAISVYGQSGADKLARNSYVRSEYGSYGLVLGQTLGSTAGSRLNLDLGAQLPVQKSKSENLASEQYRLIGSLTGYVSLIDWAHLFSGVSGQELVADKSDAKIYSANYHYGIKFEFAALSMSIYGAQGLRPAVYGYGRQEGGFALSYTFGAARKSGQASTKSKTKTKVAKNDGTEEIQEEEMEAEVSIQQIADSLPKGKTPDEMDEFELYEQRQLEERKKYGDGETEWEQIEKELETIKETERKQKEEDERKAKEQELVDRAESAKNRAEEEKRLRILEEEVADDVKSLDTINDEEANWQGLD